MVQTFHAGNKIELDAADKALVKTAVEQRKRYNIMVIGQLLMLLGENDG